MQDTEYVNPFPLLTEEEQKRIDQLIDLGFSERTLEDHIELKTLVNKEQKNLIAADYLRMCLLLSIHPSDISRETYRQNIHLYNTHDIDKEFGNFSALKKAIVDANPPASEVKAGNDYTKIADAHITLKEKRKVFFVTAAVAGQALERDFLDAIRTFKKAAGSELVVLPVKPLSKQESFFSDSLIEEADIFAGEVAFNENLHAKDFRLHAQQINPLTQLGRFGQKETSLIVAHTKMFMQVEPVANGKYPHIIHSTGCITLPENYASTRSGMFAKQDHRIGGLIIEIEGPKFHIRQALWNPERKDFFDLELRYGADGSITQNTISSFVMGDLHAGQHDPAVLKNWIEVINLVKPEYVFLHDALDGVSISHHAEGDFLQLCQHRPAHLDTLEKELNYFGKLICKLADSIPSKLVMVPSNHPEWVERYLRFGKYTNPGEERNHVLSLELAQAFIGNGMNPIQYYTEKHFPELRERVIWLKRGDDFYIGGRQHAAHGDITHSGLRGNLNGHEASYGAAVYGHTHTPKIFRNIVVVGTTTPLQVPYTRGQPTKWLNTSGIFDPYGGFQLINSIDGSWRKKVSRGKK